ncbi:hypothetical protein PQQ75_25235 [Paraburkholderia aspalathi]|uniref:hypothetical protein n=1 Tax=Paraburkholderia aspalathi TaxID=1324617 RepID=UPI0038BA5334
MKASDAIKEIQDAVLGAEKSGAKELSIANLNSYLSGILTTAIEREGAAPAISEAQAAHQLEVWKAQLSAHTAMSTEMLKSTVEAGQTALRSAIVINGGAAATIMAFAGNAITKGQLQAGGPLLSQIGSALLWFMVGVGTAGVASGFRYLSQAGYAHSNGHDAHRGWAYMGSGSNIVSIALAAASFAAFFIGGTAAYHAIVPPAPSYANAAPAADAHASAASGAAQKQ